MRSEGCNSSAKKKTAFLSAVLLAMIGFGSAGCAGLVSASGGKTTNPPPTDLVISGVQASGATTSSVSIAWITNTGANSQVDYGTTMAYGSSSPMSATMVTTHEMALANLSAGTMYHYRVRSTDVNNNTATSGDFTFSTTTTAPPAPTISAVAATGIATTGATITWSTNVGTSTQVNYGTTAAYGQKSTLNSSLVTSHSVTLSGLTASTLYHYQVVSVDGTGKSVSSGDFTFTTGASNPVPPAPTISSVASSGITTTGAAITWSTNVGTSTQVNYGTTAAYGQKSTLSASLVTSHSVALSGLTASTLYHYQAVSVDGSGNSVSSADFTFTTAAPPPLPTISAVLSTSIGSTSATITWITNVGASSQVNYGTTATYGQKSALNSSLVTIHSVTLSALTASTLYHFQAVSIDGSANPVSSADFTFTTSAAAPPGPPPVAGQWSALNANTALKGASDHCPPNGFNGFGYNFDTNCQGVFDAWTGFGYTTASVDGACMIEAGGGHSDYAGNELYEMCPATSNGASQPTGSMVRLTNPSQPAPSCGGIDPLGSPTAPNQGHSYQFFTVAPNVNKLYRWAIIAGTTGGTACANFNMWALDLTSVNASCAPNCTAAWTQVSPAGMPTTEAIVEAHGVYNPIDHKIYVFEPFNFQEQASLSVFDPVANTWKTLGGLSTNSTQYMDTAIDASQNLLLIIGSSSDSTNPSGNFWVDLSGADGYTFHHPSVDASCSALASAAGPGLDYDSKRSIIVGWPNNGNKLYFPHINKAAGTITCATASAGSVEGTDFPRQTGFDGGTAQTFSKFHYDSLNDMYVLHNNYNLPAWVWKP